MHSSLFSLFTGNGYPKYGGIGGQGGCVQFIASEKVTMSQLAKMYAPNDLPTNFNKILIFFKYFIHIIGIAVM